MDREPAAVAHSTRSPSPAAGDSPSGSKLDGGWQSATHPHLAGLGPTVTYTEGNALAETLIEQPPRKRKRKPRKHKGYTNSRRVRRGR